jgi:hypothetical protein
LQTSERLRSGVRDARPDRRSMRTELHESRTDHRGYTTARALLQLRAPMSTISAFRALLGPTRRTASFGLHTVVLASGLCAACVDADPTLGETVSASTVNDFGSSSGCSTAVVIGLSAQIADEIACLKPGSISHFDASSNLVITSNSVLQYLDTNAKNDLVAAAQSGTIQINSAFRTVAQQYLLYHWYLNGRCGITAAATVGHSNHESFRAVDVANYSSRITAMRNHGWAHDVSGDPVHFDPPTSAPRTRSRSRRCGT